MVAVSIALVRSSTSAARRRSSNCRVTSSVQGRLVLISTSDAMIDRASLISPTRTL
jgi:hypothetical protein